jgi:hypothetical protein
MTGLLKHRGDPQSQQRIAAESEEVIVGSDGLFEH